MTFLWWQKFTKFLELTHFWTNKNGIIALRKGKNYITSVENLSILLNSIKY